jgi:ribosomal protection tetracycline resistance protein
MALVSGNKPNKYCSIGLLAHVDAGKTTLSEGLLYAAGAIREMGRVDKRDAYLDTNAYERERGITIFSKQAVLKLPEAVITLLDTPGHVDFSAEMERALWAMDYAALVISGADGIQGHTKTLWKMLETYQIPVFLFVNKMDQQGTDAAFLLGEIKRHLSDCCISFEDTQREAFFEEAAMCSEEALDAYLQTGTVEKEMLCDMIAGRKLFPCYFGSALKNFGVEEFFSGICQYTKAKKYPDEFGARVFKITRDPSGLRLTHLKITGGKLKARELIRDRKGSWEEKVNQIRIYSGEKYESASEAYSGEICAVTGLTYAYAGEGLGVEEDTFSPLLEPVLTYRIELPEDCDAVRILPKLRQLEEEDPKLHILWNETHQELLAQVMGEVQMEILKRQALDRFGVTISFGRGHILYKETILSPVEGVGHYEPLRHYAEAHILMEPAPRGSGLTFASSCSEDVLDRNWQRLILTHLKEKEHIGVLTGSPVTDIKFTLAAAKAHPKHTEGGDFRQAVYRAVRQGLRQAESVLLEPYYEYRLELPEPFVGRAMTDLKIKNASFGLPETLNGAAVLEGKAPVTSIGEYAKEVASYTKGMGRLSLSYGGYDICHNTEEVVSQIAYNADADLENPSGSVFCSHGSGFFVDWNRVPEYMHLESVLKEKSNETVPAVSAKERKEEETWLGTKEVDAILARTLEANKRDKSVPKRGYKTAKRSIVSKTEEKKPKKDKPDKDKKEIREEYLLVDGYNIIHAWEELRELSKDNMDGARGRLLDLLCNYQGLKQCQVIAVFDAYKIAGHKTEYFDYHNIHVVYTKEAETADAYIERFAHENGKKRRITVATSDGMEQIIIRGAGCMLLSANDLYEELCRPIEDWEERERFIPKKNRSFLMDQISEEAAAQIKEAVKKETMK